MHRRRLLAALTTTALAGCISISPTSRTTTTEAPEDAARRLARAGTDAGFSDGFRGLDTREITNTGTAYDAHYDLSVLGDAEEDEFDANHTAIEVNKRFWSHGFADLVEVGVFAYVPTNNGDQVVSKVVFEDATAASISWGDVLPDDVPQLADQYSFRSEFY